MEEPLLSKGNEVGEPSQSRNIDVVKQRFTMSKSNQEQSVSEKRLIDLSDTNISKESLHEVILANAMAALHEECGKKNSNVGTMKYHTENLKKIFDVPLDKEENSSYKYITGRVLAKLTEQKNPHDQTLYKICIEKAIGHHKAYEHSELYKRGMSLISRCLIDDSDSTVDIGDVIDVQCQFMKECQRYMKIAGLEHILPNKMTPALLKGLTDNEELIMPNPYDRAKALSGHMNIIYDVMKHHIDFGGSPRHIERYEDFNAFFSEATKKVQMAYLVLVKKQLEKSTSSTNN